MKAKYTKFQIALEIIGILLLLGMIIFVCIKWSQLPDQIPGHYDSKGVINRWGSKNEIFIVPIVSVVLYASMTLISFFPSLWNIPISANNKNKEAVYRCTRSLLILTNIEMLGMFFFMTYNQANSQALPADFLPVTMVIIFGTLTFFVIRIIKFAKKK